MPSLDYNLGFTSASLRPELMREEADIYLRTGDWTKTKQQVLSTNPFQCGTGSTLSRFEREIRGRLQMLSSDQLRLLDSGTQETRLALSWLAAVKKYAFLLHSVTRMIAPKLERFEKVLQPSDYESFYLMEGDLHPELLKLSESSRGKVKRVLLCMLREIGYLGPGEGLGQLGKPFLPPEVRKVIIEDDANWLVAFLEEGLSAGREQAYG